MSDQEGVEGGGAEGLVEIENKTERSEEKKEAEKGRNHLLKH